MSSEFIWETFDSLWKTVNRQGRRVEELEARVVALESRLAERSAATTAVEEKRAVQPVAHADFPVERAA
jgi:BMFP domain-containing protein YqiC